MERSAPRKYPCPCRGFHTLVEEPPGTYRICPVCFWEDDAVQYRDPQYRGGANGVSLVEARANFLRFRWAKERSKAYVRAPREDEYPPASPAVSDAAP